MTDAPSTAWGHGLATLDADGNLLDVWFPAPALGEPDGSDAPADLTTLEGKDEARAVTREVRRVVVADLQSPIDGAEDAWLRLHLLSSRLAAPRTINMDGVFGALTNVVWTSAGPCSVAGFEATRARLKAAGEHVSVHGIDKFPRMVDYVVPPGVRIADADRVRLGAHLAEGTTVMHEGFVNYNAGTLGTSMVEGRISAGVVVGDGSDVGGGASIMGTLSGGGTAVISVGERCLLGANSGIGISLGDDCVVEAGCYVTAGTKVTITDMEGKPKVIKAADLSGASNVLIRRNSVSGAIEAVPWKGDGIKLNADLHANSPMASPLQRLAVASAALLLRASCSDSESPDSSEKPDATESAGSTGGTVARERFCPDIDPEEIGSILDVDGLEVVVDTEPGQASPYWTCTIGQASGTSIGVTMNLLDAEADPGTVAATLDDYASGLGAENCSNLGDETLGAGTRGVDCSGTANGTSFTMVARAVVVGGTQIECLLASYRADDLVDLQAAAPEICGLFRDRVVS